MVFMLSVLSGCQGTAQSDGSQVKISKSKVEVQDERGKSEISIGNEGEVALPEGYPADIVPVMEGAKVTTATKGADGSYSVMLTSEKPVSDIKRYYEGVLSGISDLQKQDMGDIVNMMGSKGEKTIVLNISEDAASGKNQRIISISIIPAE